MRMLALAGLILLAASTRLLPHSANFAPITAMAVFGAIRYRSLGAATLTPLIALFLSDLGLEILYKYGLSPNWGIYQGMWMVYGVMVLIILMSRFARGTRSPWAIGAMTLAGSCTFFLVTNFAVWASSSIYPHTAAGLMLCYDAAIPFFRNSLVGDITYATILFGAWSLAEQRFPRLQVA